MSNYQLIIQKLDAFIRKYYANQLIRGGLIFLASILVYVLLVTVGEYYFYFSVQVKWTILTLLLGFGIFALVVWVLIPLLKMRKLGKVISHEQAAGIIGDFFPEVEDKLLNVLQLNQHNNSAFESQELVAASIDQRASKISVLPFGNAVDLKKNKKFLPYLLIPMAAALLIFILAPKIFTEGAFRLAQPSVFFAKPAPFQFELLNKNLSIVQGQSITIKAKFKGDKIPQKMLLKINDDLIEMQAEGKNEYSYQLDNVFKTINFQLGGADYFSEPYTIAVLQKPELQGMEMSLSYPAYTGKPKEVIQGLSDLSVPVGTTISWKLKAEHTDEIAIVTGDIHQEFRKNGNVFTSAVRFLSSLPYYILLSNRAQDQIDSLKYSVQIIDDQFPQVSINVLKDSTLSQQILITGTAGDDYLVKQNLFVYQTLDAQGRQIKTNSIALKSGAPVVQFSHYFDIGTLHLAPGQQVRYFVEVWDNDGVHGSKSRRSQELIWKAPSLSEMDKTMAENAEKMNSSLSSSAAQAENLQEEYKDIQKDLMDAGANNWEKTQKLQSMLDKNLQLKKNLENLQKRFEQQQKQTEEKNYSEDVQKKQEALKDQIDNLKDKQLEEQIKKLQALLDQRNQQNQQNSVQEMKNLEQSNKLFQMDMERLQELMKKLEMQMSLEALAKKVDALAKQEDALKQATEKEEQTNDALKNKQDEIKKNLDELLKKDMADIAKKNEALDKKQDLDELNKQGEEAGDEMEKSSDQLKKDNKSSAKESQKQAKNKLGEMKQSLLSMSSGMDMEQLDIDIKATRQLLTNLIRFSFDQEQLMGQLNRTNANSEKFLSLTKEQNRLKKNTAMIKDSLYSLSKRVFQIAATVNKETSDLDNSIAQALRGLENRNYAETQNRQQYAMTAGNNLALLLNELLANLMQQQSAGAGSGSGGPPKPGKGKGSGSGSGSGMMKDIITGQQKMGEGMQGLKPGGQKPGGQQGGGQQGGGKQGEGKQGDGQGSGSSGSGQGSENGGSEGQAEKIARLAQQQAMLRKQLQELNNLLTSKGLGGGTISKQIRDIQASMDRVETDLVYRKDPASLMQRNKEILTRMLEAEKAIQEQEEDNKRAAQAGKDMPRPMPSELSDYLKQKQQMFEQLKRGNPALKPFYQKMSEEYLRKVQQP